MKSTIAISALSLSLLAGVTHAAPQLGTYAGASLGSSSYEVDGIDDSVNIDEEDATIIAYLGQQLNRYFATEFSLISIGDVTFSDGSTTITADATGVETSILGFAPVSSQVSVFGRLGYWNWDIDSNFGGDDGADFVYGVGIEYNPSQRLQMRVEAKRYEVGSSEEVDIVSGSVGYRF